MKTNALKMRQNLGAILKKLSSSREPIIVERNRKPAAVLISMADYQKRFVDYEADIQRENLVKKIKEANLKLPKKKSSLDLIREIRNS